jgi:hypothetical protein
MNLVAVLAAHAPLEHDPEKWETVFRKDPIQPDRIMI